MVVFQERHSHSIFINELEGSSLFLETSRNSRKMEIHISSTTPSSTSSSSSSSTSRSSSESSSHQNDLPTSTVEIQLLETILDSDHECCYSEDPSMKLLSPREIDMEFVEQEADGRLGWREMEEIDGLDSSKCLGDSRGLGEPQPPTREMTGRNAEYRENANPKTGFRSNSFYHKIRVALNANMENSIDEVTEMEIKQAILLSASMNMISLSHEEAGDCASLIMEELNGGSQAVKQYNQVNKPSKGFWHAEWGESFTEILSGYSNRSKMNVFFRSYWRRVWIVTLWLATCAGLFAWKFMQYRKHLAFEVMGYCLSTAKGAAETLKLNMALVLLTVCRNAITWLRRGRRLNTVIPFNDSINFHKLIAGGIVIGIILHGGTHLACDFPRIANADAFMFQQTIADCFQYHQPSYGEILLTTEGISGISMVILMIIAFLLATKPSRRRPAMPPKVFRQFIGFNAFWYSHHLFVAVYVLLVIHSMFLFLTKELVEKTTWMYLAIPVLLYVIERLFRIVRSENFDTEVLKVMIYPGKVLSLKLKKPAGFNFCSGMYVYIQCPEISRFEWHPYSITSAPCDDYLGLHMRSLGDWSYQVYDLFNEALVGGNKSFPKVYVDGPYGAASQDHAKYEIVLLIGLGIGATPFVSILKDIANILQNGSSEKVGNGNLRKKKGIKKAYFYWVTREQGSFDWFRDIMTEISALNKNQGVIEMHNYLTSVFQEGDNRSALVSIVQALHFMKCGIDIISKTPVRTEFSRPNWTRVFCNLARRHGGQKIGVFYCGQEILGKELESLCHKMTMKTSARFVFHKEHY